MPKPIAHKKPTSPSISIGQQHTEYNGETAQYSVIATIARQMLRQACRIFNELRQKHLSSYFST
jgi:hypothetical protein